MSHKQGQDSPGLSRRDFLKRSGAATLAGLGAVRLSPVEMTRTTADFAAAPSAGRLFDVTELRAAPDDAAPVIRHLMPDSVTPIVGLSDDGRWYEIEDKAGHGYIPRTAAQPVIPYSRPALVDEIGNGFWAEVVAPSSTIRQWCHATAPIIDTLGFGAVVYAMDRIVAHGQVWYGLSGAPGEPMVGWAVGLQYAAVNPSNPLAGSVSDSVSSGVVVVISSQKAELSVIDSNRMLMRTPILGNAQRHGEMMLSAIAPGGPLSDRRPLGLPWPMRLGSDQRVYSAFWHNNFGLPDEQNVVIQMPVLAARYLYGLLSVPLRAVVE